MPRDSSVVVDHESPVFSSFDRAGCGGAISRQPSRATFLIELWRFSIARRLAQGARSVLHCSGPLAIVAAEMRWRGIPPEEPDSVGSDATPVVEPVPDWVPVVSIGSYQDAIRVRMALDSVGMPFMIPGENFARIEGGIGRSPWTGWLTTRVLVRPCDLEQAHELLRDIGDGSDSKGT